MSLVGIPSANPAYSLQSVLSAQIALFTAINQESSGSQLTNPAGNPSGIAIYNNLSSQAQGADTANENISDASNAINVAQGATSTISSSLTQINNLAIEANNGFNSASDEQALQDAATQLAQGVNQIAGQTNFNGTPLLDGTTSGNTPATAATAAVTNNDAVGAGGAVLASASASGATTSGTFSVAVDGSGKADVTYTDSTTQATTSVGSFAAGSSTTYNGTTLNFGNFSASDAGTSATVQTTAASAGSTASTVTVQSGANEGQTTNVSFANATTTGLGITNIDLSNPASATNTEGQISGAITSIGSSDASLGAQSDALGYAFENNNTLSNNLTASASAIGDTSEASASIAGNLASLQQQISIAVLARANTDAGHLNSFLSQYA
jgi:flagellin